MASAKVLGRHSQPGIATPCLKDINPQQPPGSECTTVSSIAPLLTTWTSRKASRFILELFCSGKLVGFLSFSCLFFFFNRSGLCFILALSIKAVASENSWPALIFISAAALRSQHHPPCRWRPQDFPSRGWHPPAPTPATSRAPAPSHGTAGCFCCLNGVDNAGCLFPHLPPRSLSTHAVVSLTTDCNLAWEKNSSEFHFNARKWVSHVAGEDAANRKKRQEKKILKTIKQVVAAPQKISQQCAGTGFPAGLDPYAGTDWPCAPPWFAIFEQQVWSKQSFLFYSSQNTNRVCQQVFAVNWMAQHLLEAGRKGWTTALWRKGSFQKLL